MAGIKRIYEFKKIEKPVTNEKEGNNHALTDDDVRRILHSEFLSISGFNQTNNTQFIDPNRFF